MRVIMRLQWYVVGDCVSGERNIKKGVGVLEHGGEHA